MSMSSISSDGSAVNKEDLMDKDKSEQDEQEE